jgi:hypothetical protein
VDEDQVTADASPFDVSTVLAQIAGQEPGAPEDGSGPDGAGAEGVSAAGGRAYVRLMGQLAVALAVSARKAGAAALTSGRWLADVVVDAAPHLPVRDLDTLRRHYKGLEGEALADAMVRNAVLATAGVGVGGGALSAAKWMVPVTLVTIPLQLAVETAAVAAIEIKLVAELHEVYGVDVPGSGTQRGTAFALAWANRRGINPLEPATLTAAFGAVARQRVQRRLVGKAGRNIGTLAPMMLGAAYGGFSNRRQTLQLADQLRLDLRRRRALTGGAAGTALAVVASTQKKLRPLLGRRRPR